MLIIDVTKSLKKKDEAERAIRHLATFPLHNPEIVIEIKRDGSLSYGNPTFYEAVRRLGLSSHAPFVPEEVSDRMSQLTMWKATAAIKNQIESMGGAGK